MDEIKRPKVNQESPIEVIKVGGGDCEMTKKGNKFVKERNRPRDEETKERRAAIRGERGHDVEARSRFVVDVVEGMVDLNGENGVLRHRCAVKFNLWQRPHGVDSGLTAPIRLGGVSNANLRIIGNQRDRDPRTRGASIPWPLEVGRRACHLQLALTSSFRDAAGGCRGRGCSLVGKGVIDVGEGVGKCVVGIVLDDDEDGTDDPDGMDGRGR
ncbi:hypothetical protein Sjap_021212 [Stephania japonica]|uniref:Uncharacterized protein n=1 Tax=Stephania japonica TaxID=461633 RepID=A0AAP0F9J5_9MAGN